MEKYFMMWKKSVAGHCRLQTTTQNAAVHTIAPVTPEKLAMLTYFTIVVLMKKIISQSQYFSKIISIKKNLTRIIIAILISQLLNQFFFIQKK